MADMKSIRAVVRTECVRDLIEALKDADVPRFYVTHVHVFGAGVDPMHVQPSVDEGSGYTEKAAVDFLCRAERVEDVVGVIRERACTGHRGDGVVLVSDVSDVISIRTGEHDRVALL